MCSRLNVIWKSWVQQLMTIVMWLIQAANEPNKFRASHWFELNINYVDLFFQWRENSSTSNIIICWRQNSFHRMQRPKDPFAITMRCTKPIRIGDNRLLTNYSFELDFSVSNLNDGIILSENLWFSLLDSHKTHLDFRRKNFVL